MAYVQKNNPFKLNVDPPSAKSDTIKLNVDPSSAKSDTIKVMSIDQALARKKLQRKFKGRIPKGAKLTKEGDKYVYTVIKPK